MTAILATGGLDEAAIAIGLAFDFCAFIIAAGLIALSWWKRSLIAAIIAVIVVLVTGLLLAPWKLIVPLPRNALWVYYGDFKLMSVIWLFLVFVSVACLVRAIRYRKMKAFAHKYPC